MTYSEAKARRDSLDAELREASAIVRQFPRNAIGLTPDAVKFSPDYRAAKARSDAAFSRLRRFNEWFIKAYAAEIKAERAARFA